MGIYNSDYNIIRVLMNVVFSRNWVLNAWDCGIARDSSGNAGNSSVIDGDRSGIAGDSSVLCWG